MTISVTCSPGMNLQAGNRRKQECQTCRQMNKCMSVFLKDTTPTPACIHRISNTSNREMIMAPFFQAAWKGLMPSPSSRDHFRNRLELHTEKKRLSLPSVRPLMFSFLSLSQSCFFSVVLSLTPTHTHSHTHANTRTH